MKKIIIIFILISAALLNAQIDDLLISIEKNMTDTDQMNIYHITQNYLIAGITRTEEKKLKDQDLNFNIIDNEPWSQKYYLVSHPKDQNFSLNSNLGKIIFDKDNLIIIKTEQLDMNNAIKSRLMISELKQTALKLKNNIYAPQSLNFRNRTDIDTLIDDIHPDSIGYVIQSLQDFVTRYTYHENRKEVSEWIQDRFWDVGIEDVVLDSFFYSNIWHYNVVATIPGTLHPDQYVLLGGHHDSIVHFGPDPDPMIAAPGADDNASSVAAAIEIARVMVENNYQPESSIKFVTFAAEEVGLWGAYYYSSVLAQAGADIRMMLNCDMIANNTYAPGEWILDIPMYSGSEYLRDIGILLMEEYTTLNFGSSSINSSGSDSYAFFVAGFPVSYYFEREFSPHYHSIYDVIENCDLDYCEQIIRLTGAMVSVMETMPTYVTDFNVIDSGTGDSMILEWSPSADLDFDHYSIGVGIESGVYDDLYSTTDTTFTITDLTNGQEYYFALVVIDQDENSSLTNQQTGTPQSIPSAPENLVASPVWLAIDLNWDENTEMDLAGYNIYRSNDPEIDPEILNNSLVTENYHHDAEVVAGEYYYYKIEAVDLDGNSSEQSSITNARAISLDSGLLVIDDSEDGNGTFMHPTDEDCDLFINYVMDDFSYEYLDNSTEQDQINLSDFGPFSTVLWLVNSSTYGSLELGVADEIASYLDFGGNFIFIGLRPSLQLDSSQEYPAIYTEGDLLYDYFNINSVEYSQLGRFYFAESEVADLEDITVDTLKAPLAFNYHLYNIESIVPEDPDNIFYSYDSLFDDDEPFGVLNGTPVGVFNETASYSSALFSFPLYYMEEDESKNFITTFLENYFSELSGSDESDLIPTNDHFLLQNYPNPFNPETVICFQLSDQDDKLDTELAIYNVKGQKIRDLSSDAHLAQTVEIRGSRYYSITWDGTDDNGSSVSSGLYLYKFSNGDLSSIRKMLLLK